MNPAGGMVLLRYLSLRAFLLALISAGVALGKRRRSILPWDDPMSAIIVGMCLKVSVCPKHNLSVKKEYVKKQFAKIALSMLH